MTTAWVVVVVTGLGTLALKGAGPLLLGGRALPRKLDGVVRLAGPALLAALVATSTFAVGQHLVLDERLLGMGVAVVAIRLRAPALVVVVAAATTTAIARALTG